MEMIKTVNLHKSFGSLHVLTGVNQTIHKGDEDISLFLRVTQPFKNVKFTVTDGETVLLTAKRLKAAPGEMEKLTLKADKLKDVKPCHLLVEGRIPGKSTS